MIFINPDCYHGYRFPSLGMMYIAAKLRAEGLPASYIDCNYESDWRERLAGLVADDPLIGVTGNVLSIRPAMRTAGHIRAAHPEARIVMGGPFPSVEYARLMPKYADAVAVGEGEATGVQLARGVPFEQIDGLAYMKDGAAALNPRRPFVPDLDALPFPAWELGNVADYRLPHTRTNPVLPMVTSRGCPYNCVFCGSDIINGNRIRYRSVENVIEELTRIYSQFKVREIQFWDDNITLKRDRIMQLCEEIIKRRFRGLNLSIPSGIKPDLGDDEMFRTMARAGFYFICIAVESGSQEVMRSIGKKVDTSKVREVVKSARRAGMLINGFFMIGLPYDTVETMEQTVAFARSLPLDQALFFITIPFPGTELYEMVKREGKFLYHTDDDLYERGYFEGRAAYEMPGRFDAETVEAMYRKANRAFFMSIPRAIRLISKRVRRPYDLFYLISKGLKVIFFGRQFK